MTDDERWRVAWETVVTRIDDLAACLATAGGTVPLSVPQLAEVNRALGQLNAVRRNFYDRDVPRLIELWQPGGAR